MEVDSTVFEHEFGKFIENLHDYFGDEYGKEHDEYLINFLLDKTSFYKSELELYDE